MKHRLLMTAATVACVSTPVFANTESAAVADDQIVVTGSPLERPESEAFVGVSVLSGDELERNLAATIGETLRREPGVSSTAFGAGASRPIIRGQGGDRVRVLDNGIGSIDASASSPDHAVAVDPALASRIEIVRGASLLRYGSSGAGGVVNVIDGRIPTELPEGGVDASARLGRTSVDEGTEVAGGMTFKAADVGDAALVLHLDGTFREANDYDIPGFSESAAFRALEEAEEEEHDDDDDDHEEHEEEEVQGTVENSFSESSSFAAGASLIGERGFFGISVRHQDASYGLPGGHHHHEEEHEDEDHDEDEEEHEEGEEENVFLDLEQTRVDVRGQLNFDSAMIESLNIFAGVANYEHIEFEGEGEVGTIFSNEGWEARFEAIQRQRGDWRGATGIQLRHRDFSAIGEEAFVPETSTDQFGIYTFQEVRKGPWLAEGAIRFEQTDHEVTSTGVERSFDGLSVSAGVHYDLAENVHVGGTLFRTERAPTTEELFSNGPHLATEQFEVGDADLDTEIATGIEGILRFELPEGSVTVTAFHTAYDGYIFDAATGEEDDELPVFQFQSQDAVFKGVELDAEMALGTVSGIDFGGDLVIDYVEAELDVDGNDNLPRIPPLGVTVGVDAEMGDFAWRAEAEYSAEQTSISQYELPTDEYTLLNAFVTWRPSGAEAVAIQLSGHNLTDEEARMHTSHLKDLLPLPGRNIRLSVKFDY